MGLGVFPSVRLSSRYRILTMAEIMNYFVSFLDHEMKHLAETHFVCTPSVHTCWIYFTKLSIGLKVLGCSLSSIQYIYVGSGDIRAY
jgi:hypothetical protein